MRCAGSFQLSNLYRNRRSYALAHFCIGYGSCQMLPGQVQHLLAHVLYHASIDKTLPLKLFHRLRCSDQCLLVQRQRGD